MTKIFYSVFVLSLAFSLSALASMGGPTADAPALFARLAGSSLGPDAIAEIQDRLIDVALRDAERDRSEATFDQELGIIAQAVAQASTSSGIETTSEQAMHSIIAKVDAENWSLRSNYGFSTIKSVFRSQGVTTDNDGNWWYSCSFGLLRTNSKFGSEKELKMFPLPRALSKLGDNHIGDIDYYDGVVYAPAEDGPKYLNPYVVLYDAHRLTSGKYFRLPQPQQKDGVPYVALDPGTGRLFSSLYYNVQAINVYDMKTLEPMGQIPMSMTVNAIQGAKVLNGMMYMTANAQAGKGYAIYKLNLATGTVLQVGTLPSNLTETEGFTFSNNPQGDPDLNILGVVPDRGWLAKIFHFLRHTELMDYRRDQPSLRDQLRQAIAARN